MKKKYALKQKKILDLLLVVVLAGFFLVSFKFFKVAIQDLRPIADDYCNASVANMSVFSNLSYWYNLWSGDIFQTIIAYTFVAKPILEFPYGLGSAIALLTGLLLLSSLIFSAFKREKIGETKFRVLLVKYVTTLSVVTAAWITYWWIPVFFATDDPNQQTRYEQYLTTILSWQTVNSPYVIQSIVSLAISLFVLKIQNNPRNLFLAGALGFLVGTSGYVLAVTLIVFVLLETFTKQEIFDLKRLRSETNVILFGITVLIGMWISGNSPGAINRKSFLVVDPNYGAIFSTVSAGIFDWLEILISKQSLYLIFIGALLLKIFEFFESPNPNSALGVFASRLMLLSFAIFQVSLVSEIFSYKAFWHSIFSHTFLFLGLLAFGGKIQSKINSTNFSIYKPIEISLILLTLFISMYGLSQAETRIENRRAQWDSGPAPAPNGQPADREQMWINDCWLDLRKMKTS